MSRDFLNDIVFGGIFIVRTQAGHLLLYMDLGIELYCNP